MAYVFVVVGARLSLQQGQQIVQTGGEFLLLDLHKQPTNLSAESLKAGLESEDSYFRPERGLLNPWNGVEPTFSAFSHVLTSLNSEF